MAKSPSHRLTLTLDFPEITLNRLSRVANLWADLVRAVSAESTGKSHAVKWVITEVHFGSPLTLQSEPEPVGDKVSPAIVGSISDAVINGMERLAMGAEAPPFFNSEALSLAKKLALQSDAEHNRQIIVSNGTEKAVVLNASIASTVDAIFGPVVQSVGSIEGKLEGVLTHGNQRFYLWDSLGGNQVRCLFGEKITLERVLSAYGKRVAVSGIIKAKARTGERLSIEVGELVEFPSDDQLIPTDDILRLWGGVQ